MSTAPVNNGIRTSANDLFKQVTTIKRCLPQFLLKRLQDGIPLVYLPLNSESACLVEAQDRPCRQDRLRQ